MKEDTGMLAEIYHIENVTGENDHVSVPADYFLPRDERVAELAGFLAVMDASKEPIRRLLPLEGRVPWRWQSRAMQVRPRVVRGFPGEEPQRLTLYVVVCAQTQAVWHELEQRVKAEVKRALEGLTRDRDVVS